MNFCSHLTAVMAGLDPAIHGENLYSRSTAKRHSFVSTNRWATVGFSWMAGSPPDWIRWPAMTTEIEVSFT